MTDEIESSAALEAGVTEAEDDLGDGASKKGRAWTDPETEP